MKYFTKLIGKWNGVVYTDHKLFLCSRDIQVGDEFIIPEDCVVDWDLRVNNKGICTSISMGNKMFHYKAPCSLGGIVHSGVHADSKPYKVIGEISPDATWVKEGDEFEEHEIKQESLTFNLPLNSDLERTAEERTRAMFNVDSYTSTVSEGVAKVEVTFKEFKIKGPCGHFH
jgi:hypothetical protein